MRKDYSMPQTQAQTICVSQLMVGSTNSIGINEELLHGSDTTEIVFGG